MYSLDSRMAILVGLPMLLGVFAVDQPRSPNCPIGVLTRLSGVTLRITLFSGSDTYKFP